MYSISNVRKNTKEHVTKLNKKSACDIQEISADLCILILWNL